MSDVLKIRVTDRHGKVHVIDALEDWRVMEIIRDAAMEHHALGIKAECGGAAACATCHVYVGDAWRDKLVPPTDEEIERLDEAFEVDERSRLSCQILMREELDGLEVTLAPGSEP